MIQMGELHEPGIVNQEQKKHNRGGKRIGAGRKLMFNEPYVSIGMWMPSSKVAFVRAWLAEQKKIWQKELEEMP